MIYTSRNADALQINLCRHCNYVEVTIKISETIIKTSPGIDRIVEEIITLIQQPSKLNKRDDGEKRIELSISVEIDPFRAKVDLASDREPTAVSILWVDRRA